ncbi:MAG: outer membrane lipoprotein-sorting protein [Fidelibacterota bacterium]
MRIILLAFSLLFSISRASSAPQELSGSQIIEKMSEVINPAQVKALMKQIIITTSGKERTFVYESFSKNRGEKNLIRYISPRRVKGQAFLMLNYSDDIWSYFPRTERVRKLASHAKRQKIMGSDFTYEDMGSGEAFKKYYNSLRLEDKSLKGVDCYIIQLTPREGEDISYSKIVAWIRKTDFFPLRIDYYEEDKLLKKLILSDIDIIEGVPTARSMTMYNVQDNTKTIMEVVEVSYNVELPDEMFTERGLKR